MSIFYLSYATSYNDSLTNMSHCQILMENTNNAKSWIDIFKLEKYEDSNFIILSKRIKYQKFQSTRTNSKFLFILHLEMK